MARRFLRSRSTPQDDPESGGSRDSRMLEEYRAGYPRYTALLSSYPSWFIFRRFDKLRARLLLLKQDKLTQLENQLERIDQQETSPLFLGVSRSDRNVDRLSTLLEIEAALIEYDELVERTGRILSLQLAEQKDTKSLQTWVNGTGQLAKNEMSYLSHQCELVSLVSVADSGVLQLESWVEDKLIRYLSILRPKLFRDISAGPDVYIHRGPWIRRAANAVLILLIIILLMVPVVICNAISTISVRIIIIILFTVSYLSIISFLTRSKIIELILAGATYATVLIVFVSGSTTIGS
ncbi:uncharacterized protein GGS22DRAFT_110549 [Annulohypoxylon maeteangense]|uniref:uncharacterized protein n=1 Tax=Annulohypoxylon maeteangense TaxID=1927788 RepID=UPI002007B751|nr:uncharacterized protein GGS22DRAFT_110549 [Annulohypoxylon maeteangense]KAI0887514.1 hypothetical protein GGS22DRAFT_110549 [Annulohypoxylon maeteangense]